MRPDFEVLSPAGGAAFSDLLIGLRADAAALLTAASVYREPVGREALFGTGPARIDCGSGGLDELIAECVAAGLMTIDPVSQPPTVQVASEVAAQLCHHLISTGRSETVARAHRCAANYWQWRIAVTQQDWQAEVHDLLEARHHLIEADDLIPAETITEGVCSRLHALGKFAQEEALIADTLARLPAWSPRRAAWTYRLGITCQLQADYAAAQSWFLQALSGYSERADTHGMAGCYGNLGALAHARGDYVEAERCYCKSLALEREHPAGGAWRSARHGAGQSGPVIAAARPKAGQLVPVTQASQPRSGQPVPVTEAPPPPPEPAQSAPVPQAPAPPRRRRSPRPATDGAGTHRRPATVYAASFRRHGVRAAVWVVAATVTAAMAVAATRTVDPGTASSAAALTAATATRDQAAAWVARWVADDAIVSCDPLMCAALQAHGLPAARILQITPGSTDPLGSDVVAATAAVRSRFGRALAAVYAPAILASFGSGSARIDVRVIAPSGSAAYRHALLADLAARRLAGATLLGDRLMSASARAARQLAAGLVDSRLLITLSALLHSGRVAVVSLCGAGPGAGARMPMLCAAITTGSAQAGGNPPTSAAARAAADRSLAKMVAFLRAQRPPLLAARIRELTLASGLTIVRIEFAAPSPLGLLNSVATAANPANG